MIGWFDWSVHLIGWFDRLVWLVACSSERLVQWWPHPVILHQWILTLTNHVPPDRGSSSPQSKVHAWRFTSSGRRSRSGESANQQSGTFYCSISTHCLHSFTIISNIWTKYKSRSVCNSPVPDVSFFLFSFRFSLKENNEKNKKNTFTCVACHPKDDCIATGHEDGKIRLWWVEWWWSSETRQVVFNLMMTLLLLLFILRRNLNQKKEYTYLTLHWHHAAVSSLCFTPQGNQSDLSFGRWTVTEENCHRKIHFFLVIFF